jgi:hypothetical protein
VRLGLPGACTVVLLGACGGTKPSAPPAPVPGPESAPVPAAPSGPLHYRLPGPLAYEVERYDSLFYASMPGAPQSTAKRGILTVRPLPGRSSEVEVRLDSLAGLEDTGLSPAAIDSSIGSRWQLTLGPAGPRGTMLGGHPTILSGQVEAIVRLLFPQLPPEGLRSLAVWADSTVYRLRLDAFDAFETAERTSQAVPAVQTTSQGTAGVTVEANERLARSGTAMQAGQTMTLKGTGLRRVRYVFAPGGWVSALTARDSLDLVVTVGGGGETVPVRWRSTLIGRARDLPLR